MPDFDKSKAEFEDITSWMVAQNPEFFAPRITEIVETHLGQGKKVADCSRAQVMLLHIIVDELKELKSDYEEGLK